LRSGWTSADFSYARGRQSKSAIEVGELPQKLGTFYNSVGTSLMKSD
jgi:hypothetical protein